jgi:hypothetical protein
VDEARLRFLFGEVPAGADLGDADERERLLRTDRREDHGDLRLVVAGHVLDGEPPATWQAAQRLLGRGMGRDEVLDQLELALAPFAARALDDGVLDTGGYTAALARLPVPDADAAYGAYLDVVAEHGVIGVADLEEAVAARLGMDPADPVTQWLLGDADRAAVDDDPAPVVTTLAPDLVVHVPTLTAGTVLTHRLSAAEHAEGYLELDTDLAGFRRVPEPRVGTDPLYVDDPGGPGPVWWTGPADWLADLPRDALLAVRVAEDGAVTVEALDTEPVAPPGLVAALRAAYERELEEPGLPVDAEHLLLAVLHDDRSAFAQPRPPLTALAAAAGLQRRGHEFAHAETVWEQGADADRHFRLMHRLGPGEHSMAALQGLDLLAGRADDPAALRRALDLLQEPDVLVAATEEWLGADEDPRRVAELVELADRLIGAAGRSPRAAVARWVAAVAAERDGRVLDAESHLRAAVQEAAGWPFTEDRLAWYESDRGEAAAALARWTAIGMSADDREARVLAPFAAATVPEPGRNQPCWCGSGRKFKQCHLGRPARSPLPERVGWLCQKADAYLDRRGGAAEEHLLAYAELRSPDVDEALADPLVRDVALHEGAWWERFLAERGPLLPADEAALGASWLPVERTVSQVVAVAAGTGVTVRDLRTGDRTEVTERTFSLAAVVGQLVCARAVPDGAGSRFVGGTFTVPRGQESALREVLDRRDGAELLLWAAGEDR